MVGHMTSLCVLLYGGAFREIVEWRRRNKNSSFSYPCPRGVVVVVDKATPLGYKGHLSRFMAISIR
jgi:hypothetical protein